ncbi:MAG: hypothetical protein MZV64_64265 [Ignavibacteriales bacterium]|nr:hypothetical protein [Ignavibacteriales bacterium]
MVPQILRWHRDRHRGHFRRLGFRCRRDGQGAVHHRRDPRRHIPGPYPPPVPWPAS